MPTVKLFRFQLGMTLLLAIVAWVIFGQGEALAFSAGGLVHIVPNWFFARLLFRYRGAQQAKQIAASLYMGEAIKYLMTFCLFAMAFRVELAPAGLMAGFIIAQTSLWFASDWVRE